MKRCPPGVSLILVRAQALPAIEPVAPPVVTAVAESKLTEPKSASGRAWQANWLMHSEGASTIHSAELTSIEGAWRVLRKTWCWVRFSSSRTTWWPVTVTDA